MFLDDALERFMDEWIVFRITRPDDWRGNHEGFVVAHEIGRASCRERV